MMDFVLEAWVSANIERAKASWILGNGNRWQPGQKLKLLFAGYNGTRNTGSDVRPEETLRQWFVRVVNDYCDGQPKRTALEDNIAVFVKLATTGAELLGVRAPAGYLHRILHTTWIDAGRRRTRGEQVVMDAGRERVPWSGVAAGAQRLAWR